MNKDIFGYWVLIILWKWVFVIDIDGYWLFYMLNNKIINNRVIDFIEFIV